MFKPKTRNQIAAELGKRFKAGEAAIAPRLVSLLTHENARFRHGALRSLDACGNDVMLSNLSKIVPMLDDPKDFVRITAIELVSKASEDKDAQLAILKTTVAEQHTEPPNSVRNSVQSNLFSSKVKSAISDSPFKAGFDDKLVEKALTKLILEETGGGPLVESKVKTWDKDTVVRLAGPLTFIAEEEQVYDQMFGARNAPAQAMLGKFGYLEGVQTNGYRLLKKANIPRHIRAASGFKDPMVNPDVVFKQPGVFADYADEIKTILIDSPSEMIMIKDESTNWIVSTPLSKVLKAIEANKTPAALPSIAVDVRKNFQAELNALDGTGAKMKWCRDTLADPQSMQTFRQIAAMDALVELSGPDAVNDLLPYLGHDYWRLSEHSRRVAADLVKGMPAAQIAKLFAETTQNSSKTGFLQMLTISGAKGGLDIAKQAMKHESPAVRAAAIGTFSALGGEAATGDLVKILQTAESLEECHACEDALLSRCAAPATAGRIRDQLIAIKSGASTMLLDSVYYLLARIGDAKSIEVLRQAATTEDPKEFARVMFALSYSPSREADKVMLEIAAKNPKRAAIVGVYGDRRMVIGPKGYGDIDSKDRMDFAEAILKLTLEPRIIQLLGTIHEARALRALMFCLEKGVGSAAKSIVENAEGMEKLSPADAKIAAETLRQLMEYIEVSYLRGGIKAHMSKDYSYTGWKSLQARAGKSLLKFHKPETAPIPTFDGLDLDR
jgi:HEAT repeat protein